MLIPCLSISTFYTIYFENTFGVLFSSLFIYRFELEFIKIVNITAFYLLVHMVLMLFLNFEGWFRLFPFLLYALRPWHSSFSLSQIYSFLFWKLGLCRNSFNSWWLRFLTFSKPRVELLLYGFLYNLWSLDELKLGSILFFMRSKRWSCQNFLCI